MLVIALAASSGVSAQPRSAVLVAPFTCDRLGPTVCDNLGVPLAASFSGTCVHGALTPNFPMFSWHTIPTRRHGLKIAYIGSAQEEVGTTQLTWTTTWVAPIGAPFAGRETGTGTWHASGLPSCAHAVSGKSVVLWTHRPGRIVATYTLDGLS